MSNNTRQFTSTVKSCKFYKEKKNRQFSALFKASVFDAFQKIAYVRKISANFLLGEIVEQFVADHIDLVEQYDKEELTRQPIKTQ